ncbi:oxygenase MpaB family protein [Speluncibacter jeojiensis]|uniref:DUF2236 domain-containing protein n=1 Tax=Speluncibacter jeojiensis TaxID=2710754 RepID=A0A9X4RDE6_9ACTN|nr:DUF2236 domain-containing protein [Corynebacteriales bacterium D3-21]
MSARNRYHWKRTIDALDARTQCQEIVRILHFHEFPWDMFQSGALAQFRTFAVPTIGALLAETAEYTDHTQKRVDDTALILGTFIEHDLDSEVGRQAFRRLNHMHGAYEISNDDMLYTLATLVVGPIRWVQRYGWRRVSDHEITAMVNHMHNVGRRMGIKDVPTTYGAFERFYDDFEATHFAYSAGGAAVADATLDLMTTYPPNDRLPARLAKRLARAVMDRRLADALHYRRPTALECALVDGALWLRGRVVRFLPPRTRPLRTSELPYIRTYPDGYRVDELGTFPRSCPVRHVGDASA